MATKKSSGTRTTKAATPKAKTTKKTAAVEANGSGAAAATAPAQGARQTPHFDYPPDVQENIRQRAYKLFEERGGQHGFDVEDWLRAEAEARNRS